MIYNKYQYVIVKIMQEFESRAGQKWARDIIVDYYTRYHLNISSVK
jgi:hypothetical protein